MFKLFFFAALLALAYAKPSTFVAGYTAPVAYSAYSAYTAPVAYSAYSAYSPYAYAAPYAAYASPYAAAYTYLR